MLDWIRGRLSFCLLYSAIQCIQRTQSSEGHYITSDPIDPEARIRSIATMTLEDVKDLHDGFCISLRLTSYLVTNLLCTTFVYVIIVNKKV